MCGSFIFFRVEMMEFLIFKDGKGFGERKVEAIGVLPAESYKERFINSKTLTECYTVIKEVQKITVVPPNYFFI